MLVSVSTYSFQNLMNQKVKTQFETLALAKELGFDAVEIVDVVTEDGLSQLEMAHKLKTELDRLALPITNFTFGADFLTGSAGNLEVEIERVKKMIDLAEILGAKSVRHDATSGQPGITFDQALPRLAEGCRAVTEYAQTKGIMTMVENHGFFSQDSTRVEKLYQTVNHPNFKLLVDIGNFLCVDEKPQDAVSRVAPYAGYAHVKDFHIKSGLEANPGQGFFMSRGANYLRGAIIGQGNVPVTQCLTILKNANYQGNIAIEFEGMEDNIQGVKISLANLRGYLAQVFG